MITSLYAGLLGILYFFISLETIKARGSEKVSLGTGNQNQIIHIVSAHSNFASYTPIFLLLFYFLETFQINFLLVHMMGIVFITGRILHYLTMKNKEESFKQRKLAMQLTLWPLIILSSCNIFFYFIH